MSTGQIILGILLFAVVTAILYVWGLRKSMTQARDLEHILLSKCSARVVKALHRQEFLTRKEIARQIQGVRAGLFWSRNRLEVQNAAAFAEKLIVYMQGQHLLEDAGGGRYRLQK